MYADTVLINGKVFSFEEAYGMPQKTAVAIKDGKIAAVGNNDEVKNLVSEKTQIIDCGGGSILPGLCDAHAHPSTAANIFISCQLFDITGSPEETCDEVILKYTARLAEYCREHEDYSVIKGNGWNRAFFMNTCREKRWPDRHDLDRICADRPVVVESYCLHCIWVNTKAIELAGLSEKTPDPETGEIVREESGYPAGVFFDMEAINLIKNNLDNYDYTVEQYKQTLKRFQKECASCYGITLVNDCMCTENAVTAYKELAAENELDMRFRGVYLLENCNHESVNAIKDRLGKDNVNETFEINTIKVFVEGEFVMLEPYSPEFIKTHGLEEGYCGRLFFKDDELKDAFAACMETGKQIHIHAMGDGAVHQAVEALCYAQNKTGKKNRNVIAHLMAIADEDLKLMGENDIMANLQPRWMIYDSDAEDNYVPMFGKDRALELYPCRKFYDAGCEVAYGTDFPVTPPPNPFHGIQCAVTRSVFKGDTAEYENYKGRVLGPEINPSEECVSLKAAIKSSSWSGAYQNFLENITGSIEVGKSADIAVLNCDIESINIDEIYSVEVDTTIFRGKTVYKKGE